MQTIETEQLTGRLFVAAGNRNVTKYPNLAELHRYYPCGEPAICNHAGIELELLHAVLCDGEPLEYGELLGLARLYGCPISVLNFHRVIMLDVGRPKHRKMITEVENLYTRLKCMALGGNEKATQWLELTGWTQQGFMRAVHANRLSYCHYLGVKEQFGQYISFSTPSPKGRGLSPVKGDVIHVTKTVTFNEDGTATIGSPKSEGGKRDIPLNDTIKGILSSQRKKLGNILPLNDNRVFVSIYGSVVHNQAVNRAISGALSRLEAQGRPIEHFTAHALRDTFATRYIEQGGSPQTLKTILGHSSLAMTMDLYSHVLPNTKQQEMDKLKIVL